MSDDDGGTALWNAGSGEPASRRYAQFLNDLEAEEMELLTKQQAMAAELANVNDELARIARVREAILGKPAKPARAKGQRANATAPDRRGASWVVSEERVTATKDLLTDEPMSVPALAKGAPMSPETIRRALRVLIERGEAREAGHSDDRGGATLYALP
jgi:hypothetical protein